MYSLLAINFILLISIPSWINFFILDITNSNSSGTLPQGKILFGNDLEKVSGIYGQNLIISPYNMFNFAENGGIIISPGFSYLFEISCVNIDITSNFTMSFSWWEENMPSFMD